MRVVHVNKIAGVGPCLPLPLPIWPDVIKKFTHRMDIAYAQHHTQKSGKMLFGERFRSS